MNDTKKSHSYNQLQFYERNPFQNQRQKKINFQFYIKEISLKMNRTKKKVHQKIEITFNFTKEIPLKMNRTKKKGSPKNKNHLQFYK